MRKLLVLITLVAVLPFAAGCNALEGTLLGGGVGAGTGAIIGSATGRAGAGTAIGAGVGALTGLIVGSAMEQQEKKMNAIAAAQAGQPVVQAAPAGTVIVACPRCGQHVDVSDFAAGSKVRCPVCNSIFTF